MKSVHEAELLGELSDRHAAYLVYDGAYRLKPWSQEVAAEVEALVKLFQGWRQRVYRFENDYGASVVLYEPVFSRRLAWDLMLARFFGRGPFTFDYADGPVSGLEWAEVQGLLDEIKRKR
jgi:hypothetical protein